MNDTWTVCLGRSIIGTILLGVRLKGQARKSPRSRDELPWKLVEYLEAEDRGGRIVLRSSFDEILAWAQGSEYQRVTRRRGRLYVTFSLSRTATLVGGL